MNSNRSAGGCHCLGSLDDTTGRQVTNGQQHQVRHARQRQVTHAHDDALMPGTVDLLEPVQGNHTNISHHIGRRTT
jgi:hypothetical protein